MWSYSRFKTSFIIIFKHWCADSFKIVSKYPYPRNEDQSIYDKWICKGYRAFNKMKTALIFFHTKDLNSQGLILSTSILAQQVSQLFQWINSSLESTRVSYDQILGEHGCFLVRAIAMLYKKGSKAKKAFVKMHILHHNILLTYILTAKWGVMPPITPICATALLIIQHRKYINLSFDN